MREARFVQISRGSAVKAHRCTGINKYRGAAAMVRLMLYFLPKRVWKVFDMSQTTICCSAQEVKATRGGAYQAE